MAGVPGLLAAPGGRSRGVRQAAAEAAVEAAVEAVEAVFRGSATLPSGRLKSYRDVDVQH